MTLDFLATIFNSLWKVLNAYLYSSKIRFRVCISWFSDLKNAVKRCYEEKCPQFRRDLLLYLQKKS